jgi:hypothetical protein
MNEADAYLLFRLTDDSELADLIDDTILDAAAWMDDRAPTAYAEAVDDPTSSRGRLFKRAEAYLTLNFLVEALKARKVYGTHAPYDEEDSSSFATLIDTEWVQKVNDLIGPYLETETGGPGANAFALPVFGATEAIDATDLQTTEEELGDIISDSESIPVNSRGNVGTIF